MSAAASVRRAWSATARPAPSWSRTLLALVRRGLRDNRRAPLVWGGGLGVMCGLMTAIWPAIESSIGKLVQSYPSGLKKAFGIAQLDSVEQYIDAEMLSIIVPLALAWFAVRCVIRATVAAEDRRYLDTLLSLPVSRRTLVAATFAVTGIVLAEILVVMWVLTYVAGTAAGTHISAAHLAAGLVNVWPLAMAFGGLAVLAAGITRRPSTVTAVAAGTLVAMYVVDVAGKLAGAIEPLRVISPFRYYGSAIQNGLEPGHVAGLVLVAIALATAGAVLFERRDVR